MRTILTILLTSLVWAIVITCFFEPRNSNEAEETTPIPIVAVEQPSPQSKKEQRTAQKAEKQSTNSATKKAEKSVSKTASMVTIESIDYAREIVGQWSPVEGAKHTLEITKYGVAIHNIGYKKRVKYNLKGKKLAIHYDNARCEITEENGVYYLEIYNSEDFSGKYKRTSQPRKIAMRPLDSTNYAEAIVGKWSPINGQEYTLELTKYGTAIQNIGYERRVEYSLNGSSMRIHYDNAKVVISEDASNYYLEIYNSEDFSGRYRKSK